MLSSPSSWCLATDSQPGAVCHMLSHRSWMEAVTCLDRLATPIIMQIEIQQAFITTNVHCWLMFNMFSSSILHSLSEDLLSIQSVPNLYSPMELFLFRCKTLDLSWLTFMNVVSPFLQLLEAIVNSIHLPSISSASPVWCHLDIFDVPFCSISKAIGEALYPSPVKINLV